MERNYYYREAGFKNEMFSGFAVDYCVFHITSFAELSAVAPARTRQVPNAASW